MSLTDSRELPKLIPGFQSVGPDAPHGIIIFSRNHGAGWVCVLRLNRRFDRRLVGFKRNVKACVPCDDRLPEGVSGILAERAFRAVFTE
jgi:hypothetical protein